MLTAMTTLASRTIAALRAEHDQLVRAVPAMSAAQLTGPSGAADWTVADVLSHLGSGAEITLAGVRAALGEAPPPGSGFNESVWDRWNAMPPEDQAARSLEVNADLVAALEAFTAEQQETVQLSVGFLPQPVPLASFAGLRLHEAVHHGWDVRVAADPAATLGDDSAGVLADHLTGGLSFLMGFIAKPAVLAEPAVVSIDGTPLSLVLTDRAALTSAGAEATAVFRGRLESVIRLIAGRLTDDHTPPGVTVTGNVSLADLREVFPGF
jgi:uncharacterized protein (TIGR03083 family)